MQKHENTHNPLALIKFGALTAAAIASAYWMALPLPHLLQHWTALFR